MMSSIKSIKPALSAFVLTAVCLPAVAQSVPTDTIQETA